MATTKPKKATSTEEIDDPAAVASRVEVRIGGRVVYMQDLFNATLDHDNEGVTVNGSLTRPKVSASKNAAEEHVYNPVEDENPSANTATDNTVSTVPAPTPVPSSDDPRDSDQVITQFHDGRRD